MRLLYYLKLHFPQLLLLDRKLQDFCIYFALPANSLHIAHFLKVQDAPNTIPCLYVLS